MQIVVAAHEVEPAALEFYCVTFYIPQYRSTFLPCWVLSYKCPGHRTSPYFQHTPVTR